MTFNNNNRISKGKKEKKAILPSQQSKLLIIQVKSKCRMCKI